MMVNKNMTTVREASVIARMSAHGCRIHGDAMSFLFQVYRNEHPSEDGQYLSLERLWNWVDRYLENEPTPLS